jgi:hypothetical protein
MYSVIFADRTRRDPSNQDSHAGISHNDLKNEIADRLEHHDKTDGYGIGVKW